MVTIALHLTPQLDQFASESFDFIPSNKSAHLFLIRRYYFEWKVARIQYSTVAIFESFLSTLPDAAYMYYLTHSSYPEWWSNLLSYLVLCTNLVQASYYYFEILRTSIQEIQLYATSGSDDNLSWHSNISMIDFKISTMTIGDLWKVSLYTNDIKVSTLHYQIKDSVFN